MPIPPERTVVLRMEGIVKGFPCVRAPDHIDYRITC